MKKILIWAVENFTYLVCLAVAIAAVVVGERDVAFAFTILAVLCQVINAIAKLPAEFRKILDERDRRLAAIVRSER